MTNSLRARIAHEDRLDENEAVDGQVILHHGDPSYVLEDADDPVELPRAESLFLRIIAYLAFAEKVCIPARYILASQETFSAVRMAEPLLRAGLVCPERRAEVSSCEELALTLGLPEAARRRGEWLDAIAKTMRIFQSTELAAYYRSVLLHDLSPNGGLRRAMGANLAEPVISGLEQAHEQYALVTDGTPEAYSRTIGAVLPGSEALVLQWAMARYYITPTVFDTLNTREVPRSAATLLIRGAVLDEEMRPLDVPAPAEAVLSQLEVQLPAYDVRSRAREFCEAVLAVRQNLPVARQVFADVQRRAELSPLSNELAELMQRELNRQRGVRRSSGTTATVVSSLGGAGIGLAVGQDPAIGIGVGVASGLAGNRAQKAFEERRDMRKKPWLLAIDHMTHQLQTR